MLLCVHVGMWVCMHARVWMGVCVCICVCVLTYERELTVKMYIHNTCYLYVKCDGTPYPIIFCIKHDIDSWGCS